MRKKRSKAIRKTKTVPYDVAEQLRTPEEMAAYLDAWLSEAPDDVAGIPRALGQRAPAQGASEVARGASLKRGSPYQAPRQNGYPELAPIPAVAPALGLR